MTKVNLYRKGSQKRQVRTRSGIFGTSSMPRLSVFRSNKCIYAQIIDDTKHATLVSASSIDVKSGTKIEKSVATGKAIAKKAIDQGIKTVVFDRGSYRFHGRVKALADGARESGLKF